MRARHLAWALLLAHMAGCELVVSLDDLHNGQCKAGEKECYGRCVSLNDPATGCAAMNSCSPCLVPHATTRCIEGVCAKAACIGDYEDCDPTREGCETDLAHDPEHCGDCFADPCVIANGIAGCSAKHCAVGGCYEGWDDCNREWRDGCERQLGTSTDCAGCDLACAAGMSCVASSCR